MSGEAPAAAVDPIGLIVGRDEHGSWVHEFRMRGRLYTLVPGGCSTFDDRGAIFRVWPESGGMRDVRVSPSSRVEIVSRIKSGGSSYPEGSAPWGDWTPSR